MEEAPSDPGPRTVSQQIGHIGRRRRCVPEGSGIPAGRRHQRFRIGRSDRYQVGITWNVKAERDSRMLPLRYIARTQTRWDPDASLSKIALAFSLDALHAPESSR